MRGPFAKATLLVIAAGLGVASAGGSSPVLADSAAAAPEVAAVIEGATLSASTLIGVSGQVYEPASAGGWQRVGHGGVACGVLAAYRIAGDLWAMCGSAPLFRRAGGVWSAEPLTNRGRVRSAQISASPLISVGRHVYAYSGGKWDRRTSAPSNIDSLLAESARSGLAVTSRGELLELSGSKWRVVVAAPKRRKPTDDLPESVFGSAKNAYVVFSSGAIQHVESRRTKVVTLPSGTAAFSAAASCAEPSGAVLAIGRAGTDSGGAVTLLRFSDAQAIVAGAPPILVKGERIGILYCASSGEALLSTSRGRLLVRASDGSWTERSLSAAPAEAPKTSPGSGPAKSG